MSLIHSVYDSDHSDSESQSQRKPSQPTQSLSSTTATVTATATAQRIGHSQANSTSTPFLDKTYKHSIVVQIAPDVPALPRTVHYAPNTLSSFPTQRVGLTGRSEPVAMNESDFNQQLRLFHSAQVHQSAHQVSQASALGVPYIDPLFVHADSHVTSHSNDPASSATTTTTTTTTSTTKKTTAASRKRKARGDVTQLEGEHAFQGPWAGFMDDDEEIKYVQDESETMPPLRKQKVMAGEGEQRVMDETAEAEAEEEEDEEVTAAGGAALHPSSDSKNRLITPGSERSIFHGGALYDHVGRSYMALPVVDHVDFKSERGSQECYLPKRCIHTYRGHTKGVNAIRLFPNSGHLMLSASMDTKVKLWDVHTHRHVVRTFLGHNKAVRDICFNNLGDRFLTASYDRYLKLWDTETGQCIQALTTGKIPFCVKFHPDPDKQHIFLTGQQDKKIYQFDVRSGEIVQEYNQHLGAVNTITFVDQNRRFITTSDDKTLRAWEYDIPVVIKYVAEPHMHSMPSIALSPNKKWLACQSLDNQILLYGATDKFKINRKKSYHGHMVAGYACQVNFSADGRYVMSGDASGHMFYWDFKTCRLMKKHKAHDNVVMGCEWHPHETSKVFTCSWDNTIKLWD